MNARNATCRLASYDELGDRLKAEMTALRDLQPVYDSPFFDLDLAGLLADVRPDTRFIIVEDEGGLTGYWPLHVRPNRWARPLGGPFADWHGPVVRSGEEDLGPTEFLAMAGLRGMTAPGLRPVGLNAVCAGAVEAVSLAHVPDGAEAYLSRQKELFPKQAKNMRRAERLIARDFGEMRVELDDMSPEAFDWLMATKQEQFKRTGRHDVLGPDWARQMMRTLRETRHRRLRGRLSTLRFGDQLVAAEFNLLSDKIIHGWIVGFDQRFAKYSPGHLLVQAVICGMEASGHEIYDLGSGSGHTYKKYYESFQVPVENAVIRTGTGAPPLTTIWRMAEGASSGRIGELLQSIRRRSDQICSTELGMAARIRGFATALNRPSSRQ